MFFVMGITGRVGGAVAKHLLDRGSKVRSLIRDRSKLPDWVHEEVELVEGDWSDAEIIKSAVAGVEGAFVMLPPVFTPSRDFSESKVLIKAYAEAFGSVRLPRAVILSSYGADKTDYLGSITPLALLEQGLRELPYPTAFIRPGSFYENYLYGLQSGEGGVLPGFFSDGSNKAPMTAIDDIASEATKLLTGPTWSGRRIVELGSLVSPDEIAAQLGNVLGRAVAAQAVPRKAWPATMQQMGLPEGQTWAFEEMLDSANAGWIDFGVEGAERVEGTTTARDVFEKARNAARS
jgi:uncharacterized protein YbjT (DUF2867 family)